MHRVEGAACGLEGWQPVALEAQSCISPDEPIGQARMRRRLERHGLWHADRSELHVFSRVQARGADQLATRRALVRDGGRAQRASCSQLASPPSMRHAAAHGACAAVDAAELDEA